MQEALAKADIFVCHGGTGSLITGLKHGCHVIVAPRQFSLGEHYDDHQSEITDAFDARGLVLSARNEDEFAQALVMARTRESVHTTSDPRAMREFLRRVLARMNREGKNAPAVERPVPVPAAAMVTEGV